MSLKNFICERIVLPISDLLTGEQVYHYLAFLKHSALWSDEKVKQFQDERLRLLIRHAVDQVPFYQDYFQSHGLRADDIRTQSDLHKLPIVDKALIRKEGLERFVARNVAQKDRIASRSSGSTGEPFSFYVSKEAYSVNTAAKLYTWYQAGYRLGDKYMKVANGQRHGFLKKVQDRVNNCVYVPFLSMSDEKLAAILSRIEKEKPKIIRSYPVPLYLLAKYRNGHPGYCFKPDYVMTTGSTLPEAYRVEIEEAFGCYVIDSYSCEGTPNTAQTPAVADYRVTEEYGIMEVLDEKNVPVADGIGRVVSTDLWNYAMPFIRYDSHDLVEVKDREIQRIMGRECEAYISAAGNVYTVHNFSRYFLYEMSSVTAYQVVRMRDGAIRFRLVVTPKFTAREEENVVRYWAGKLGRSVTVEIVDGIPIMKNNKRLTIVDE